jgi:hypothetical protein
MTKAERRIKTGKKPNLREMSTSIDIDSLSTTSMHMRVYERGVLTE